MPHWSETDAGRFMVAELYEKAGIPDIPPEQADPEELTNADLARIFITAEEFILFIWSLDGLDPDEKREELIKQAINMPPAD